MNFLVCLFPNRKYLIIGSALYQYYRFKHPSCSYLLFGCLFSYLLSDQPARIQEHLQQTFVMAFVLS